MRTYFQLFRIFIYILGITSITMSQSNAHILTPTGHIQPEVITIFQIYEPLFQSKGALLADAIKEALYSPKAFDNKNLERLNTLAQATFLRPAGMERYQYKALNKQFLDYQPEHVLALFKDIGSTTLIKPLHQTYDYILVHGSTVPNMRKRIQQLADFIDQGLLKITSSTQIVFLTGERDLFETETHEVLLSCAPLTQNPKWVCPEVFPATEDAAAEWIWNQCLLPKPLRMASIRFMHTPKTITLDPKTNKSVHHRPTTMTTTQMWIDTCHPKPGRCLSISSQPYIYFQEATVIQLLKKKGLIKEGFTIEGAGVGFEHVSTDDISILLDNLARTIHTELHTSKLQ